MFLVVKQFININNIHTFNFTSRKYMINLIYISNIYIPSVSILNINFNTKPNLHQTQFYPKSKLKFNFYLRHSSIIKYFIFKKFHLRKYISFISPWK